MPSNHVDIYDDEKCGTKDFTDKFDTCTKTYCLSQCEVHDHTQEHEQGNLCIDCGVCNEVFELKTFDNTYFCKPVV